MGLTLVGFSGTTAQRGIELDETGVNLESFSCRYFPQFKDKLNNKSGQVRGFAIPDAPTRELSIQGEVIGNTGIMAATFATAMTIANDVETFGGDGGFYMDDATESQSRDGWRSISLSATADPLVA